MLTRRMVTVCPVVPWPPEDGGRKRTMRLLEAAERVGLVPHLLTVDAANEDGAVTLRARGWTVEVLPEPPAGLRPRLRQHLMRLPSPFLPAVDARLRQLVAEAPTLVQIEHTQSAYYGDALAGVPSILSLHNVDSELMRTIARARRPGTRAWATAWGRWQSMRAVERRSVGAATAVFCVSAGDGASLGRLSDDVFVVPNGVDDAFFSAPSRSMPSSGQRRILFFGQLDYEPNALGIARFLAEGWPRVLAARPDVLLRLVGAGASTELRDLADTTPGVERVGFVEDLVAELASAEVAVVPLWAGGGTRLKVLEAMAAAAPVVGTSLGVEGIGFRSDVHGLIRDTPAELAAGVLELLAAPQRANELARAGQELAEQFRWTRALAPAEAVYRDLARIEAPVAVS